MKDGESTDKAEIVIVRRRGGDDGAAGKGGAWKIAYADFVTAMMAFFLVMWLINASNEETRAQVASYFNPIKLTDSSTGERSVKDMKETRSEKKQDAGGEPPSKKDAQAEAALMADPQKSLERIATASAKTELRNAGLEHEQEIAPAMKPDTSNPGVGDPFDPKAWEAVKPVPTPAADETKPKDKKEEGKEKPATLPGGAAEEKPGDAAKARAEMERQATELAKDIAANLGKDASELTRALKVETTAKGILISLTEQENFEMFETGSAKPRAEALKLVAAVAAAVKARNGFLVIRGHTDARPYRNKYYDNWQLSTARAHFARYMLVSAGLEETRIRRIEGVADREPRNTQDPQAAENRRIDILLGTEEP